MSKSTQKAAWTAPTEESSSLSSQEPAQQSSLRGAWDTGRLQQKEGSVPVVPGSPLPDPAIMNVNNSSFNSNPHLPYTVHVFEIALTNLRGEVVMVHMKNGSIYEGVFDKPVVDVDSLTYSFVLHWAQEQPFSRLAEFFVPSRPTTVLKSSHPFVELMNVNSDEIFALRAPGFVPPHRNVSFATDTQISANKQVQQRKLTKWDASAFAEELPIDEVASLEEMIKRARSTKWDQFSVNAKLAPSLEFDMNKYSTEIDTSAADYQQNLAEATRIAALIEKGVTTDKVVLRDRRSVELGGEDDEDDNFSTVLREREEKGKGKKGKGNVEKRDGVGKEKDVPKEVKDGVYVPPAKREAVAKAKAEEEEKKKREEQEAQRKLEAERQRAEEERARKEEEERRAEEERQRKQREEEEERERERERLAEEERKRAREEERRREEEQKRDEPKKVKLSVKAPEFKPSASAQPFVPTFATPSFAAPVAVVPNYVREPVYAYPPPPRYIGAHTGPFPSAVSAPRARMVEEREKDKREEKSLPLHLSTGSTVYRGDVGSAKDATKTSVKDIVESGEKEKEKEKKKEEKKAKAPERVDKSEKAEPEAMKTSPVAPVASPAHNEKDAVPEKKEKEKKPEESSKVKLSAAAPEFKLNVNAAAFQPIRAAVGVPDRERDDKRRPRREEEREIRDGYYPEDAVVMPLGMGGVPMGAGIVGVPRMDMMPAGHPHAHMQMQYTPHMPRRPAHTHERGHVHAHGEESVHGQMVSMGMPVPMVVQNGVMQGGMAVAGHVGSQNGQGQMIRVPMTGAPFGHYSQHVYAGHFSMGNPQFPYPANAAKDGKRVNKDGTRGSKNRDTPKEKSNRH